MAAVSTSAGMADRAADERACRARRAVSWCGTGLAKSAPRVGVKTSA